MKIFRMRSRIRTFLEVSAAMALASLTALALRAAEPARARAFDTPQQAAEALVQAAASGDEAAVIALFGPDGKDIVTTGDAVDDKNRMVTFAQLAKEKMEISLEGSRKATVIVGPE